MFKTFIALSLFLLAGSPRVHAETFLFDFNNTADANGYVGGPGAWNAYAVPAEVNGSTIANITGDATKGYTLDYTGTMKDSSNGNSNTFNNSNGGPSWVTTDGSLANTAAAADYFFTNNGSNTEFTLIIENLTPGDTLSLDLWTTRVSSSSARGFYSYSLDGTNFFGLNVLEKDGTPSTANNWDTKTTLNQLYSAESQGNNNGRYMNISSLTVGASGTLHLNVNDNTVSEWAPLGAMRLTVIPEPSTFAMMIVAGMGLLITCQRRRR